MMKTNLALTENYKTQPLTKKVNIDMNKHYRKLKKNPNNAQWQLINDLVTRMTKKANNFRFYQVKSDPVLYITGSYVYKKNGKDYYDDSIKVLTKKTSGGKRWQTKLKALLARLIDSEPDIKHIDFIISGYKDGERYTQYIKFDPKRTGTMRSLKAFPVEKE